LVLTSGFGKKFYPSLYLMLAPEVFLVSLGK